MTPPQKKPRKAVRGSCSGMATCRLRWKAMSKSTEIDWEAMTIRARRPRVGSARSRSQAKWSARLSGCRSATVRSGAGLAEGPPADQGRGGGQSGGADDDVLRADPFRQHAGEQSAGDRARGRDGDDDAVPALAVIGRELAVDEGPGLLDDQHDIRLGENVEHERAAGNAAAGGEGGRRQHQPRDDQGERVGGGRAEAAQEPADGEGKGDHGQRHQHQRLGQAAGRVVGQEDGRSGRTRHLIAHQGQGGGGGDGHHRGQELATVGHAP